MIEIYDCQDSAVESAKAEDSIDDLNLTERSEFEDDDKILFSKIGKSEIAIDKVLSNLLVNQEYSTYWNIILQENEEGDNAAVFQSGDTADDVFSHGSNKLMMDPQSMRNLVQIKGKLHLVFSA